MDFNLTDDQRAIEDAARAFAAAELAPHSARWDEEKHFPVDVLRKAAELGFAGLYVGEDVGGSALSRLDASIVFEQLSYGDVSTAAFISIHNMASWMIDRFGSDELRRRYLPRLTTMELIASYCLTEPGSGSDAAAMTTMARKDGDAYVLNGSKAFISGAGTSDIYVVMARTGGPGAKGVSAFVVELGTPGLSFGAQEKKMGWNSQPTAQVNFDDCRVPAANRIGEEGRGFHIALATLDGGRIGIAAQAVGIAAGAYERSVKYARERKAFGVPIGEHQMVGWMLADMATTIEGARLMTLKAATLK
ncbi:MAG TPA: acyl-CoA dehydrogenase family protein, partial [Verrucomicrobiae bacterium]|nr:acyl-CoA dehydrogenase family protein [Verrucomicrobiae bacterium]